MKKSVTIALLFIVSGIFTACGNFEKSIASTSNQAASADSDKAEASDKSGTEGGARNGKILVAYFSHSGNTKAVANLIHERVGGDIFRIETKTQYPKDYNQCTELAKEEQNKKSRPALTRRVENIGAYDTIFIGYPNWWGTMPMALFTFLEENDLSGKRIIPFCTHEGSGMGRSVEDIKSVCPDSTILQGLTIRGGNANSQSAVADVAQWLRDLKM